MMLFNTDGELRAFAGNFVCADTAQPLPECGCGRDHLNDAKLRAQRDPTRTLDLRRAFIRDLERRWRRIKGLVTDAVATSDMFGVGGANARNLQVISMSSGRVPAFQSWLDTALADVILGMQQSREQWVGAYISAAYTRGWNAAKARVNRDLPIQMDRADLITKLTISELQGVIEAFSQRAVRAFSDGLLSHLPPATIARNIRQAVDSIGIVRSRATVQTMIVRANGEAALDYFQLSDIKMVGVLPETIPSPGRSHAIRDAKAAGRRAVKRKKSGPVLVEVLTAGDDDVCPICEDIADDNPYTITQARGLIPAHPNCRCTFVPADDDRFAHDDSASVIEVEITYAYRGVHIDGLYAGKRFSDDGEPMLARSLAELDRDTQEVWEVDISECEAFADETSVFLEKGIVFQVDSFDRTRNLWNVKAWPKNTP